MIAFCMYHRGSQCSSSLDMVEVGGSDPPGPTNIAVVCTGDILYRLYRGAGRRTHHLHVRHKRIRSGFHPGPLLIEIAWIIIHKTDKPDLVSDLSNPHVLASKHGAEVDLAATDADSAALGHMDRAVVVRVFRLLRRNTLKRAVYA